jgi:organic hydroperoxide reductase OsmC/OhrA
MFVNIRGKQHRAMWRARPDSIRAAATSVGSLRADTPDMPAPFPHRYSATISRTFASRARVEAPPRASLNGGPSSEFDGDVASWSPEHLMLSSLGLCMLTTFEAFAARDGIEVVTWNATVNGQVERSPEGLQFSSIVLCLDMEITGNVDDVDKTIEDAKQYCLVLNSLRVPVVVETSIRTPGQVQDERRKAG